jgi:hypothetical protein
VSVVRLAPVVAMWALLGGGLHAQAQSLSGSSEISRFQFTFGGVGDFAVGEFAQRVGSAIGFRMHVAVRVQSLVSLGIEGGFQNYGVETRDRFVITNDLWSTHAVLRVQPRFARWRPYADALVGATAISTSTSVDADPDDVEGSLETIATNLSDRGPSYGAGIGLMVGLPSAASRWSLDVSLRYISGPTMNYLTQGAVVDPSRPALTGITRSATNLVALYGGLAYDIR